MGKWWKQWQTLYFWAPKSLQVVTAATKLKDVGRKHLGRRFQASPWKKSYHQPRQHMKKQKHYFANKGPSSQSDGFSSSHVWMWELDYEESWAPKNWCFWTVVLQKTLESSLDFKEIQPVNPKGNQSWIFIGRTDAEAEIPILWLLDEKKWFIGKVPVAGKVWKQKGMTKDETVGWYHWVYGQEFEQALGVGDGQGSLECCSPWWCKESDTTEWLNWTEEWLLISLEAGGRWSPG